MDALRNRLGVLLLLAAATAAGCSRAVSETVEWSPLVMRLDAPAAADLVACPNGHETLRDVPVAYGLLMPSPELDRQIANLEVWPGGCVGGPFRTKVVCTTCRFHYEPSWLADRPGSWRADGERPDALPRPPSAAAAAFPRPDPAALRGRMVYSIDTRGPDGDSDSVLYWTSEDPARVNEAVRAYLRRQYPNVDETERTFGERHTRNYDCDGAGSARVEVTHHADRQEVLVRAEFRNGPWPAAASRP